MATGAPIGSGSSVPAPGPPSSPTTSMTWEGEKMFNIYIYDYCRKRGFKKTANELLEEAELSPDSTPPINARQGLLFEWWSVFWVLFTAKSSGNGTEEAMIYTQHQANQAAQRQAAQRMHGPPLNRFMNGGIAGRPAMMPGGSMPNGVGSVGLPPGSMAAAGQPAPFPMGGPGSQMNGIIGPPGVPPASGQAPQQQQPNFQLMSGQRPPGPQQRPNGIPYQSPTMAHSPQNTGGLSQPQHAQPPMGQLGPSPHLQHMNRGGMLPPNGPQGMPGGSMVSGQPTNAPTPSFQQLGRPPSRTATPGQNNMMPHASPSMASRQPPGPMIPPNDARYIETINNEISRLNANGLLQGIRQEAGLMEKDLAAWTMDDKHRIVAIARQRNRNVKPAQPGPNNAAAGPSGTNPSMQAPNRNPPSQPPRGNNKRNSNSPGEEHGDLPRNESSPPERKRIRRSPMSMEQPPLNPMSYPHAPPPPGAQGSQQQIPNGMMRGPMNGFPHPQGMGNNPGMGMQPMGQQMGIPHMGMAMSPGMNHQGQPGMMTPQMQYQARERESQYRQTMHNLHKGNLPPGAMNSLIPGNAGSPASTDPPFNPAVVQGQGPPFSGALNSRMAQNKPMGMMPPPSPAMNGPPKDQNLKDAKPNASNGHPEGSPRNAINAGQGQGPPNPGNPSQGGTAPPTPVPGPNQVMTAPSPSAILGNPAPPMGQSSQGTELFANDFIQSVASSLDEFDPSIFRPEGGDINFERDFGQWFNPDDVGGLELK